MFDNIGKKIKDMIKIIFIIECILFLLFGILTGAVLIIPIGIFIAWVSTFILYGYGELIDYSQKQTKQNETIIALLSRENCNSTSTSSDLNTQKSYVKTSNNTGFSVINIHDNEQQGVKL